MSALNNTEDRMYQLTHPDDLSSPSNPPQLRKIQSEQPPYAKPFQSTLPESNPVPTEIHMIKSHEILAENLIHSLSRPKVPQTLKDSLKKRTQQLKIVSNRKQGPQLFRIGSVIKSKLKKPSIQCAICLGEFNNQDFVKLSSCNHSFCTNCSRDYVTYKIKMYEEVICPDEKCEILIDQKSNFYQSLPETLKKQYIKIHNFHITSNDPSLRLCPKEGCEGIIKIKENEPRICDLCTRNFCPKCYLEKHEGSCDEKEIDFLQNNLHFRQCSNCKAVIEKIQGCNHITCKCKYEFCYLCGGKWAAGHLCGVAAVANPVVQVNAAEQVQSRCCQQTCMNECDCCGLTLNILQTILMTVMMSLVLLIKCILILLSMLASVFMGTTLGTFELICGSIEEQSPLAALYIIFLPITMLMGIGTAFKHITMTIAQSEMSQFCQIIEQQCLRIWP